MKIDLKAHTECRGFFTIEAIRPDGSVRESLSFENLITDWGLNRMGTSGDYLTACHVGSGSTTPNVNDTALASYVAHTSNQISGSTAAQSTAPYYIRRINTYEFAEGAAAGNLSEVSVGLNASTGSYAFSRALLKDSNGDPTTITVLADEVLRVTYEFRIYQTTVDTSGSVDGYSFVGRAAHVTSAATGGADSNEWVLQGPGTSAYRRLGASFLRCTAYEDGATLGDITSGPSTNGNSSEQVAGDTAEGYVADSFERTINQVFTTAQANFDIVAFRAAMGWGSFQFSVSPAIPKTSNDELTVSFTHSWGRKS